MNNLSTAPRLPSLLGLLASAVLLTGCLSQTPAPVRGERPGQATQPTSQEGTYHVVRPGDTLLGISRTYNRSVADLVRLNNLTNPNQIRVGQRLVIAPPDATAALPADGGVVIQPIDMSGDLGGPVAGAPSQINEPIGGTVPFSDQAWAAVNPSAQGAAPAQPTEPIPAPAKPDPSKPVAWMWPASGQIIDKFDESGNKGIDISGKPGDPVVASAAGSVAYSGSGLRGYGKLVIINHDGDYYTAYAHNQTLLVKEGDKVTQGQKIAEMGSTDTDRPKLHFEIRRQGRPVDPMQYLQAR